MKYHFWRTYIRKADAQQEARRLRKTGKNARVRALKYEYQVYVGLSK